MTLTLPEPPLVNPTEPESGVVTPPTTIAGTSPLRSTEASDDRLKNFISIFGTALVAGQLIVATINIVAVIQKNRGDEAASDRTLKENIRKNKEDSALTKISVDGNILHLFVDKLPELQNPKSTAVRLAFTKLAQQLPESASADLIKSLTSDATPNTPEGRRELVGYQEAYAAKNISAPVVVFIHYSQHVPAACPANVGAYLRGLGIVARTEAEPGRTGPTRLDYFNDDLATAQNLAKTLRAVLGSEPVLKRETVKNTKNVFGLWLDECAAQAP